MTELIAQKVIANDEDLNRDAFSGAKGADSLDTGAGLPTGATLVAVRGGLVGKSAAEAANPTAEAAYWRDTYIREPYYADGRPYDYYAPDFRAGSAGRVRHDGRTFEAAEPELMADYNRNKSAGCPAWLDLRSAARAAWNRADLYWKVGQ